MQVNLARLLQLKRTGVAMCWSAPWSRSNFTTSAWSSCAAMYSAVKPAYHAHERTQTFTLLPRCQMTATATKERRDTSSFIILSLQMTSICRLAANHDKRVCNLF